MDGLKYLALMLSIIVTGCGGGGGGSDGGLEFAGTYRVTLTLLANDCPFDADEILSLTHIVNQNDRVIALESGRASFAGTVEPDGGFTVGRQEFSDGCEIAQAFAYVPPTGDADFNVGFIQDGQCGFVACRVSYTGIANRQ